MKAPASVLLALERACNRVLRLDPDALPRLQPLAGKVLAVQITGVDLTLYLLPTPESVHLLARHEGAPDVTLRGTPGALARLATAGGRETPAAHGVQIEGESELAIAFQEFLRSVDIDWEEQLASVTGDVVAHQVGNLFRGLSQWSGRAMEALRLDVTEYLQEESRHLPSATEMEIFLSGVDELREACDRLEARVRRLQSGSGATDHERRD